MLVLIPFMLIWIILRSEVLLGLVVVVLGWWVWVG